jgi:hypothetical protein
MSNMIGGVLQALIHGKPKKVKPPEPFKPPPPPPPEKPVEEPSGAPTEASNAFKSDEARRMLGGLPKPIQTKYAGEETDPTKPTTKKKKLLGGGAGQQTSGA